MQLIVALALSSLASLVAAQDGKGPGDKGPGDKPHHPKLLEKIPDW
jgi:hypothetical protein